MCLCNDERHISIPVVGRNSTNMIGIILCLCVKMLIKRGV